jgi:hypothetical protein
MKIFILAVLGYQIDQYTDIEIRIIKTLLSKSVADLGTSLVILGGLVDTGINKIAYDWAWENAVPTLAITPTIALSQEHAKWPLRMVNKVEKIPGGWGVERVKIAEIASAAVIFGATDHTEEICELLKNDKKQVLDLTGDLPIPMQKIT